MAGWRHARCVCAPCAGACSIASVSLFQVSLETCTERDSN